MRFATIAITLLATLALISMVFPGCAGGGAKLIVGNIEGPGSLASSSTVEFTVSASGDTGIKYLWGCDPPLAGKFDPPDSPSTKFTAAGLLTDTDVEIRVVITSDKSGPIIETWDITIHAATGLWAGEIDGPGTIEEDTSAFYSIDAGGDSGITVEWSCDPPDAFTFIARRSPETKATSLSVVDDSSADIIATINSKNSDPIVAKKKITITDTNPPGWAKTWDANAGFDRCIGLDDSGCLYVTGCSSGTPDLDPGPKVEEHTGNGIFAYLSKFDPTGDFLWARTWGSNADIWGDGLVSGLGVALDSSGNVYVMGHFEGTVDFDPGPGTDYHTSAGTESDEQAWDYFISKFNADGDFWWARTWSGRWSAVPAYRGFGITTDALGDVCVTGFFRGTTDFDPGPEITEYSSHQDPSGTILLDAFLTKFNTNGEFQWARTWGGPGPSFDMHPMDGTAGSAVVSDPQCLIYVGGDFHGTVDFDPGPGTDEHTADTSDSSDAFLTVFDSHGAYQWSVTWGGEGCTYCCALALDYSGDICVAGTFKGNTDFDPGPGIEEHDSGAYQHAYLSKLDPLGNHIWSRTWGHHEFALFFFSSALDLATSNSGDSYVTGLYSGTVDFDPGPGIEERTAYDKWDNGDVFLSKFDADGGFEWVRTWGGLWHDVGYGIASDGFSNIYVAGEYRNKVDFDPGPGIDFHTSGSNTQEIFLSKFPPDGNW